MTKQTTEIHIRKVQKSRTGWYVNLPMKLVNNTELDGSEFVQFIHNTEDNSINIRIGKWGDLKND